MAQIQLHSDKDTSVTYISNYFIDYYMASANGEYVKIYLYLLRCIHSANKSFSLSSLADKFDHTEKDVQRALRYWEKMQLLRLEYNMENEISGVYLLEAVPLDTPCMENNLLEEPETMATLETMESTSLEPSREAMISPEMKQPDYTAAQLDAFRKNDTIRELLFVTEHYLKRPLVHTDLNTLLFWYDELGFSPDLIEYLVEYCLGKGHSSLRYMDKVALAWKKDGITTVERAKSASSSFTQIHFSVMRALGISGRNLIPGEIAFIDKWSKTYGFTPDIITEACRRTISTIHQPSFEYTDGILEYWRKQNVHHLTDVVKLDSNFRNNKKTAVVSTKSASPNKFHNFKQRSYDYQQLEQQLLNQPSN